MPFSSASNIRMQNHDSSQHDSQNDSDIEVLYESSDNEDIQVTKVELSSKQKADNLIREAINNYRNCDYKNALQKLEAVFDIDPTNIMAIVALGVNTYRLGDSHGACNLLTMALGLDPGNIDAIIAKASILSNNGDLDEALELLVPALKQDPMRLKGKYNKAKSYYSKIAEEKAQNYINNGNKQEAMKFYEKVLQVDPENIEVKKALSLLKKKGDSVELICLSSDEEDEDVKDTSPTEFLRSPSREQAELSDDDQEDSQMDNSYNLRVKQFLQTVDGFECNNSLENQKKICTDTNENGSERSTSERESGIFEENCRVFNNNDITESNEIGSERSTSERESDISEQDCRVFNNDITESQDSRVFNNDITESQDFENTKKNESVVRYDDKLERKDLLESNDCEKLNINEIETPPMTLSEKLKKCDVTKSCKDKNSQSIVDSLEKEFTNNKIIDSKENENTMKKLPKKRSLPKLKRLPIGYKVGNNSLHMTPQHNQGISKQEESSKKNKSQSQMSNEKEMSNCLIESNLSNNNIENKAQYCRNDNFELENADGTLLEKEKRSEKNKILNRTEEIKSKDNEETSYFKVTNTKEVHKTQDLSRKDKKFDKNRENNKKKKCEEVVSNKSSRTEKHKIRHINKEETNEKSENKKASDKLEKRSSKTSKGSFKKYSDRNICTKQMLGNDSEIHVKNVKQLHTKQKPTDKSKKNIRNNHQKSNDYLTTSTNDDLFGLEINSLNIMKLDDFDLPDIELNMSSSHNDCDPQNTGGDENIFEEYDELNELRKDLEQTTSKEDKTNKKTPEVKSRKSINLNNVKSKNTCELLQSIRKENEKTEKMKYQRDISNRGTKEIKHNTAKESTVKQNDGKRRAILLADPIVPPSEIRKRRRRKNDVRDEDEEETPKKKYAKRKCLNSEVPPEAIAGPSNSQKTPILSKPVKNSSVEVQTPSINSVEVQSTTLNSSPSQKENIASDPDPREISKRKLEEALCNRHEAVKREFKHIDKSYIKDLVEDIEEALYKSFNGDTGVKYRTKFRSLFHNISDGSNESLFRKILNCDVSPQMLVKLDQKELASEHLARWLDESNKKQLDAIVHNAKENVECCKNQYILKNHKGELEIENDYGKEAIDMLNELPEDLSIDLDIKSSKGKKSKKEKKGDKRSRR